MAAQDTNATRAEQGNERIRRLGETAVSALLAHAALAAAVAWWFWPGRGSLLENWLWALGGVHLLRLGLLFAYARLSTQTQVRRPGAWSLGLVPLDLALGLAWGVAAAALLDEVSGAEEYLFLLLYAGALVLAPLQSALLAGCAAYLLGLVALPLAVLILRSGSDIDTEKGVVLAILSVLAFGVCRRIHGHARRYSALMVENGQLAAELTRQCNRDPLTRAVNRRELLRQLNVALARAGRDGRPLAVIALDLDGLRLANAAHGDAVGDDLLVATAEVCRKAVRISDTVARIGEDDFAVLLPDADAGVAAEVAERLRGWVERRYVGSPSGRPVMVTASVGVAVAGELEEREAGVILAAAEARVRAAKDAGGNRVVTQASSPG